MAENGLLRQYCGPWDAGDHPKGRDHKGVDLAEPAKSSVLTALPFLVMRSLQQQKPQLTRTPRRQKQRTHLRRPLRSAKLYRPVPCRLNDVRTSRLPARLYPYKDVPGSEISPARAGAIAGGVPMEKVLKPCDVCSLRRQGFGNQQPPKRPWPSCA